MDPTPDPDPDPVVFDSTKLVKSLTYELAGVDRIKENYSYDTVNRTLSVFFEDHWHLAGVTAAFKYTTDHRLTGVTYVYPGGHVMTSEDYEHIKFEYDPEKILREVRIKKFGESEQIKTFTKTVIPGQGYQLVWTTMEDGDEITHRTVFDNQQTPLKEYVSYSYDNGLGITHVENFDSLVYDNRGDLQKVYYRRTNSLPATVKEFLALEYTGREDKGTELSTLREMILGKGMDFDFFGEGEGGLGIFGLFVGSDDQRQFMKYPFRHVKVWHEDLTEPLEFDAEVTYDSKNRLGTFTGYFHDTELYPKTYTLEYYK